MCQCECQCLHIPSPSQLDEDAKAARLAAIPNRADVEAILEEIAIAISVEQGSTNPKTKFKFDVPYLCDGALELISERMLASHWFIMYRRKFFRRGAEIHVSRYSFRSDDSDI